MFFERYAMNRSRVLAIALCCALALSASPAHAGFTDALKKKINDAATKKTDSAVDKATNTADPTAKKESGEGEPEAAKPAAQSNGAGDKVSTVSTKFDFVPGDSVIFTDDFTQDDLGEFPAKWKLSQGTFEVAERNGERWLRCMSPDGYIGMKVPGLATLPEFWTLEFDFFGTEPLASAITVRALGQDDRVAWEATYPHDHNLAFRSGEIFSTTPLEDSEIAGRHHFMFMARGTAVKGYIDRQRLANVPDISATAGMPKTIEFRLWSQTKPMITNVRFAEGCRPAKDMLAEGKLVTYGIHFETASDVVLPDSAPILRQIASYLETNPTVNLKITGHTDNVGSAPSNLDLSKRRAAAVAKVLAEQFKIASERFATDGKGDTAPLASNAKPEGRAMNRRVEFAKR
jgi:outer membrane protein OmpA-like peptidoglycan-associated protein